MIRCLMVPLIFAAVAILTGEAFAQGASPAPLPGQGVAPASGASPFPPEKWAASDDCMKGFAPLREEAEKRGKLIKEASERHASPVEACKLIGSFGQAEIKMIKYIEANAEQCGIPPRIADQLKTSHKKTETMQQKVCRIAQQQEQRRAPAGPVGDFWPTSAPFAN